MLLRIGLRSGLWVAALVLAAAVAQAQGTEFSTADPEPPAASEEAPVWDDVRVVDVFGWSHSGVRIRWVGGGEALEIRRDDGASKSLKPESVRHVYDRNGNDITNEVAAARLSGRQPAYGSASAPAVIRGGDHEVGNDEFGTEIRRSGATLAELVAPRLFAFSFDAGLGYATHTGNWYAGLDDGTNYQIGARLMVAPRNYLRFQFRNQDLGSQTLYIYDFEPYEISTELSLREYLFLIGRHARQVEDSKVRSVGYAEFGFSVLENRVNVDGWRGSESVTKMGLVAQGGLLLMLSNTVAVDLSLSASWKPGFGESEGGGLLLGVHAGLAILN